jgi:hypothetical protein
MRHSNAKHHPNTDYTSISVTNDRFRQRDVRAVSDTHSAQSRQIPSTTGRNSLTSKAHKTSEDVFDTRKDVSNGVKDVLNDPSNGPSPQIPREIDPPRGDHLSSAILDRFHQDLSQKTVIQTSLDVHNAEIDVLTIGRDLLNDTPMLRFDQFNV